VLGIVATGLLVTRTSTFANGRFPEANQLVVDPEDAMHLVVRTTFGILSSADAGASWTWICEAAVSPLGLVDEELIITAGGRTSIALSNGINVGGRSLCTWERAQGDVVGQQVIDMVRSASDPGMAYAVVAVTVDGLLAARIARTTSGTSWSFVGDVLPDTVPLTIEIAPSRPQRLYLGAEVQDFALGNIDVSDDAGMTWTPHAAPGDAQSVYLSAVDPADPERIYVRSKSPDDNTLYVSEDAGASWKSIYNSADAPLTGFALSPDGTHVAVGSDNGMAILQRAEAADGSSAFTVARTNSTATRCLTWSAAGLYVCAAEASDGFTVGLSTDDGVTFRPLLQTAHLTPASCAADSTVGATCPAQWCPLATTLGASCDAPPAPRDAAVDRPGPVAADRAGCSCDVVTPAYPADSAGLLLAVIAAALARRRAAIRPPSR